MTPKARFQKFRNTTKQYRLVQFEQNKEERTEGKSPIQPKQQYLTPDDGSQYYTTYQMLKAQSTSSITWPQIAFNHL